MGGAAWLSIFGLGKASTRKHIRSRRCGMTEEQRNQRRKATNPQGQNTSRRLVACSLLIPQLPDGVRVTRALPTTTNCSGAVSSYLRDGF
jgi:hypothetical protein